ncbi:kinesin-like protein KIN-7H [Hibiscus syriacus]|uniref:kinesin-like protein KIN-7H n=1 Tax=Hibiscus syriacus TaxID=106335 RepID=UPI0019209585|nr:kinesin-like protein KIN-7H [Hibiscus syriacus]
MGVILRDTLLQDDSRNIYFEIPKDVTLNHLHGIVLIYDDRFKEVWKRKKVEVGKTYLLEEVHDTCAHSNSNQSLNEGFQEIHALTNWCDDSKGHHEETQWSCVYSKVEVDQRSYVVSAVTFSRLEPEGKLIMCFRKASTASASDQVSIRLRPLNDKAMNRICDWECPNNHTIVFKHNLPERSVFPAAYTFDRVFDSECDTAQVYEEGAKHIALSVLEGINSSIFVYGKTSSGKTYTMRSITEYAVYDIYNYIENMTFCFDQYVRMGKETFLVKFRAMEIYNEAVRDLLSPDSYPLRVLNDPEVT